MRERESRKLEKNWTILNDTKMTQASTNKPCNAKNQLKETEQNTLNIQRQKHAHHNRRGAT